MRVERDARGRQERGLRDVRRTCRRAQVELAVGGAPQHHRLSIRGLGGEQDDLLLRALLVRSGGERLARERECALPRAAACVPARAGAQDERERVRRELREQALGVGERGAAAHDLERAEHHAVRLDRHAQCPRLVAPPGLNPRALQLRAERRRGRVDDVRHEQVPLEKPNDGRLGRTRLQRSPGIGVEARIGGVRGRPPGLGERLQRPLGRWPGLRLLR